MIAQTSSVNMDAESDPFVYLAQRSPPPQCEHCQCILTVRHILVECNQLAQTRNDVFSRCGVVESLQFHPELFLKF